MTARIRWKPFSARPSEAALLPSPTSSWCSSGTPADQSAPAGRLSLHSVPLFPLRASSGYHAEVTVRCAPTDENGTVFAVVTRIPVPNGSAADRRFGLIEIRSGAMAPGVHKLTAWLVRPGHTRFELAGEPVKLTRETRPWQQILRAIPDQLPSPHPVHLICAVEVSGETKHLKDRLNRLIKVITTADTGSRPLRVSVVAYGPHSVERTVREEPVAVLAWAKTADRAIGTLRGLEGRSPQEREYLRAAQLECALRAIADNLTASDGQARTGHGRVPATAPAAGRPAHGDTSVPPRGELAVGVGPAVQEGKGPDPRRALRQGRTRGDLARPRL